MMKKISLIIFASFLSFLALGWSSCEKNAPVERNEPTQVQPSFIVAGDDSLGERVDELSRSVAELRSDFDQFGQQERAVRPIISLDQKSSKSNSYRTVKAPGLNMSGRCLMFTVPVGDIESVASQLRTKINVSIWATKRCPDKLFMGPLKGNDPQGEKILRDLRTIAQRSDAPQNLSAAIGTAEVVIVNNKF